jgi:hypothetical protein
LEINLFSPWYSWKIAELMLNNNHSLIYIHFLSYYIYLSAAGSHKSLDKVWLSDFKKEYLSGIRIQNVSEDKHWFHKSNYHMIMTTTFPMYLYILYLYCVFSIVILKPKPRATPRKGCATDNDDSKKPNTKYLSDYSAARNSSNDQKYCWKWH